MKSVFIFGAGASRQAGGPLMSDFLDLADDLRRKKAESVLDVVGKFEDVFNAISELQSVFAKSYLDLDNIESLFSAIEMGVMLEKFVNRDKNDIESLRTSLITLIYKTLESKIQFHYDKFIMPPEPYGDLIKQLIEASDEQHHSKPRLPDISFITFNYDIALDYTLSHYRIPFSYGISSEDTQSPLYLKLHGSINWGICQKCRVVVPYYLDTYIQKIRSFTPIYTDFTEDRHICLPIGSSLSQLSHCDENITSLPLIVPPTWNKTEYQSQIVSVWRNAASCLESAENIYVIGYSLPETDSFFRYLFALGSESKSRIKRFWVFDPDAGVEERFRELIGRGIESRFKFFRFEFKNAVPNIIEAVSS